MKQGDRVIVSTSLSWYDGQTGTVRSTDNLADSASVRLDTYPSPLRFGQNELRVLPPKTTPIGSDDTPWTGSANELREAMEGLKAADRKFCLFGSGVMFLHGLREEVGDLDIFVSHALYAVLQGRGWVEHRPRMFDPPFLESSVPGEPTMNVFAAWKSRGMLIDLDTLLYAPEVVRGWPCQSLQQLCMWKASIAHHSTRPNDWQDVAKIAEFLSR